MASVKAVPAGYHSIQPYLMFKSCVDAIEFYQRAFGAQEKFRMPSPNGGIGHAEMVMGDSTIMMADEAPQIEAFSAEHFGGSPVSLMFYTEDCDAAYARAVAAGAKGIREPADQPYGDRMSGIQDPFGYKWYIATHIKDMTFDEMAAAV